MSIRGRHCTPCHRYMVNLLEFVESSDIVGDPVVSALAGCISGFRAAARRNGIPPVPLAPRRRTTTNWPANAPRLRSWRPESESATRMRTALLTVCSWVGPTPHRRVATGRWSQLSLGGSRGHDNLSVMSQWGGQMAQPDVTGMRLPRALGWVGIRIASPVSLALCFGALGLVWALPRMRRRANRKAARCTICRRHQIWSKLFVAGFAILLDGMD
jgi:hypothetical protein